jgi:hypothetical protein
VKRPRRIPISNTITIGKYLVSPLTRPTACGRHAASVSIRCGRGSATHDRVLRFVPMFDTATEAARYAAQQGMAWIAQAASRRTPSTIHSED